MVENKLTFSLVCPEDSGSGALAFDLTNALDGLQDAVRLTVQHLGGRDNRPGQPPNWIREQSTLRLVEMRVGSLVADLVIEPPIDGQAYLEDLGNKALMALQQWDGTDGSTLPRDAVDVLGTTASKLSDEVQLWLGDPETPRKLEVQRKPTADKPVAGLTDALLHGWLKEVNWDKRTAQLHDYLGGYVRLRFNEALDIEMLRVATQYVEIRGQGRLNAKDEWTTVDVNQLIPADSRNEPFDLEAFRNAPNPKVFDPEKVITAREPFDVDEFLRFIDNTRDDGNG